MFRVGIGFDAHRLVLGRPLVLGGVKIPFERGLEGHSDADVLLHAVADAILGALSLGDLGQHFPDGDPRYAGADSRLLLGQVASMVRGHGWEIGNIDVVVIAQRPLLAPFRNDMVRETARALGVEEARVNIKATTTEGMGFTGSGDGIASQAVVLLTQGETLC